MLKLFVKKLIPKSLLALYHKILALAANVYFGRPSNKLIVIGVTGTNGKTTVSRLIAEILKGAGFKVGLTSTAEFEIAGKTWLNDKKMTMLGRFELQKLLKEMVSAGCQYAVIETSSQGIVQYRHLGINYDVAVLTNLTPEHIEAHGGFEKYKQAKGELFRHLTAMPKKNISGKTVEKKSVVNLDDEHASFFLQFSADKKFGYTAKTKYDISGVQEVRAQNLKLSASGSSFEINSTVITSRLIGEFSVYNCLAAAVAAMALGINLPTIKQALEKVVGVPGRLESIDEGQPFQVLVDYAPEPVGLTKLYQAITQIKKNHIIHVLGSCGGGRDQARRPIMGDIAGRLADYVIITNEDPYDDNPQTIIDEVAAGAIATGKILEKDLFKILDRREAIKKAMSLAKNQDLVLITGKGCEQAIVVANNKKIPWDDRRVAREELKKLT